MVISSHKNIQLIEIRKKEELTVYPIDGITFECPAIHCGTGRGIRQTKISQ